MRIQGKLRKTGKYVAVEIESLGIYTQGKSHRDALAMAKDAVAMMLEVPLKAIEIKELNQNEFMIVGPTAKIIGLILKQLRLNSGLSQRDVAKRMKQKSINGYVRYESGKAIPSIVKLEEIVSAINPTYGIRIEGLKD